MHPEQSGLVLINSATYRVSPFAHYPFVEENISCPSNLAEQPPSKLDSATLGLMLAKSIQYCLGLLVILDGAVGNGVGHNAELAQEDLPEEQIDPRVQDLVERGHTDRRQEEVAVQMEIPAGGVTGGHGC